MKPYLSIGAMLLLSFLALLLFDWLGRKLERFLDEGIDQDETDEEPMEVSRRELDGVRHRSSIVCREDCDRCASPVTAEKNEEGLDA